MNKEVTYLPDGTKVMKLDKYSELRLEPDNKLYVQMLNANGVIRNIMSLGQPQELMLEIKKLIDG